MGTGTLGPARVITVSGADAIGLVYTRLPTSTVVALPRRRVDIRLAAVLDTVVDAVVAAGMVDDIILSLDGRCLQQGDVSCNDNPLMHFYMLTSSSTRVDPGMPPPRACDMIHEGGPVKSLYVTFIPILVVPNPDGKTTHKSRVATGTKPQCSAAERDMLNASLPATQCSWS